MRQETTLTGKWQFVGAEKQSGSQWQPTTFVEGMAWEFSPQYFGEDKTIGIITETTPSEAAIEMAYAYNTKDRLLKIDIYTDSITGTHDQSEADFYDVEFTDVQPSATPIIVLSILSQEGCQLPYLRYTLQKML